MKFRTSKLFRSREHSRQEGGSGELPAGGNPGTILLIEDDLKQLQRISRSLQDNRYDVVSARDRGQAMELAGRDKISMMVISPSVPGLEICELLEAVGQEIPYLLMISSKEELDGDVSSEITIRKPVRIGELKRRIDKILCVSPEVRDAPPGASQQEKKVFGKEGRIPSESKGSPSEAERKAEAEGIEDILAEFDLLAGEGARSTGEMAGRAAKICRRQDGRDTPAPADSRPAADEGDGIGESTAREQSGQPGKGGRVLEDSRIERDLEAFKVTEQGDEESGLGVTPEPAPPREGFPPPSSGGSGGVADEDGSTFFESCQTFVSDSIRKAGKGDLPDIRGCEELTRRMIGSLEKSRELLLAATDREQAFTISGHCVNVVVFSLTLARTLELTPDRQARVGLAALLHEVGVVRLPPGLTYKDGPLSREELFELRQRPIYSREILSGLGEDYSWLAETVGQIYEREDGTGFPRGLVGEDILEEAKIIGVTDLFDACIHSRPYRGILTGYEAVLELTGNSSGHFSERILKAMIKAFSLYPLGEYVRLSSGEIGKVIEVNPDNLFRPRVKILYSRNGEPLDRQKEADLAFNPSLYIKEAITRDSLPRG